MLDRKNMAESKRIREIDIYFYGISDFSVELCTVSCYSVF